MHQRIKDLPGRERGARAIGHVLAGLLFTGGAVLASALIARSRAPSSDNPDIKDQYDRLGRTPFQPPPAVFGVVWPPLFIALTLSGLRLWNAPASAARTRALGLWTAIQGLNALWMALGPRRLGGQLTTAVATLGTAGAFALQARRVDAPASGLATPYVAWIAFANLLTADLWRRNRSRIDAT